ncbi:FkbM family methyltransferase [Arhodomonas aquaeolei]|uniref:FkbM family methyltransferase n=1 Tax=Arhodomonas aquaeolei TaxID=2369 RepID=UPI001B7FBD07|nr:FkbM family methyltransferase [Arhodomonas aquaeolei]
MMELAAQALADRAADPEIALKFLNPSHVTERYVVGRNEQSLDLIRKCTIHGLIDDFRQGEEYWHGIPVVSSRYVPEHALVANCSTSISPVNVSRNLHDAGIRHIVSFGDLLKVDSAGSLPLPWFIKQQREDMERHGDEWEELFQSLADGESRQTLLDIVQYRLTADPRYMEAYTVRLIEQYFEPFLDTAEQVFVDAGGFDGDTTQEFCARHPDYHKVFLFEPSPTNMAAARERLKNERNIHFVEAAISDEVGSLRFNVEAGPASSVCDEGGASIAVTTLDQAIQEPVTWIKMDLEGWEIKALRGAKRLIHEHSPQLSIATYHRASDFREIYAFIRSLNPSYQVRLRHYTQGWSETVMYFSDQTS